MNGITVPIVDDSEPFREGLRALLATTPELEVVAEAGDGLEAIAASIAHQPDVVLMDLNMPGMSGLDATREIVARSPHVAVLGSLWPGRRRRVHGSAGRCPWVPAHGHPQCGGRTSEAGRPRR